MLQAASRAFSEMLQPSFRHIFWKSLGLTLALLFVVWLVIEGLVTGFVTLPYPWLETSLSILTGIGAFFLLGFLVAPATSLFAAFFQDDIAELVEKHSYPGDPAGKALPLMQSVWLSVKFASVVVLGNIVALILLLVPGVNLIAFFVINGYLLGREYFEFAAMRFMSPAEARQFRQSHGGTVFMAGLIIAGMLAVPLLNLLTPIFATIFMMHMYKRLSVRTPEAGPAR